MLKLRMTRIHADEPCEIVGEKVGMIKDIEEEEVLEGGQVVEEVKEVVKSEVKERE